MQSTCKTQVVYGAGTPVQFKKVLEREEQKVVYTKNVQVPQEGDQEIANATVSLFKSSEGVY